MSENEKDEYDELWKIGKRYGLRITLLLVGLVCYIVAVQEQFSSNLGTFLVPALLGSTAFIMFAMFQIAATFYDKK